MEIKDLQPKQGKVNITVQVVEKSDIREFEKFGSKGRVCNATIKDASGEMKLTLWNDDIDKVKEGDTIKIVNGYVSEFQGEKQLSTGKYGSLELVQGDAEASASDSPSETTEESKASAEPSNQDSEKTIDSFSDDSPAVDAPQIVEENIRFEEE